MAKLTITFSEPLLYDRVLTLSAEYDIDVDRLVCLAVKRLLDDVDFVRELRTGKA